MLLYAGKDDPLSLDSCLHAHYPFLSPHVVVLTSEDHLSPWAMICWMFSLWQALPGGHRGASETGFGGGPNCRTWSILPEELVWGFANRFFTWNIPGIPWSVAPLPQLLDVPVCGPPRSSRHGNPTVGHTLVKFDQCRLGQLVEKATSISSDLEIQCWDGLRCNHAPHKLPEDMQSPTRAGIIHPVGRGHLQGLE